MYAEAGIVQEKALGTIYSENNQIEDFRKDKPKYVVSEVIIEKTSKMVEKSIKRQQFMASTPQKPPLPPETASRAPDSA